MNLYLSLLALWLILIVVGAILAYYVDLPFPFKIIGYIIIIVGIILFIIWLIKVIAPYVNT